MIVGPRIQERLLARKLSQAELARRVKMDQSTINGLIKGDQRSTTKLHQIARELGTTPAYLNGETDDPTAEAPSARPLSAAALELVTYFEALTSRERAALLTIVKGLAKGRGTSPLPDVGAVYRVEDAPRAAKLQEERDEYERPFRDQPQPEPETG